MSVVLISPKGQILIPKRIREKYGVKPGSRVQILEQPGGIVIKPAPEDPIAAACGFLEGDFSLTEDLVKEHKKELENVNCEFRNSGILNSNIPTPQFSNS